MKTIAIIGAMELEIKLIKEQMTLIRKVEIAGLNYYIGEINGQSIVLTNCGIGKVNAASSTQILIDRFKVDAIINTGIAGGLHENLSIGDVVISNNVTYHDVRKGQMRSCFPFKEYFEADEELIEIAEEACSLGDEYKYYVGRVVSGECFVEDSLLKQKIIDEYTPHCVEMEGAAIGHVATINQVPFVVIRTISDEADEEATMNYESFELMAAERSSKIVIQMLELIKNQTEGDAIE